MKKFLARWRRKQFVKKGRKAWKGWEKTRVALRHQRREFNKLKRMCKSPVKIAAWRCKDYGDDWIYIYNEADAMFIKEQTGCLMQSLVVWETLS